MSMRLICATFALTIAFNSTYAAAAARILGKNEDGKAIAVALDSHGIPREDLNPRDYPSIKDFREDYTYYDFCYEGTEQETKKLLEALVNAADGDGDSWADLKSIEVRNKVVTVLATITDESGEKEETYTFPPCP